MQADMRTDQRHHEDRIFHRMSHSEAHASEKFKDLGKKSERQDESINLLENRVYLCTQETNKIIELSKHMNLLFNNIKQNVGVLDRTLTKYGQEAADMKKQMVILSNDCKEIKKLTVAVCQES